MKITTHIANDAYVNGKIVDSKRADIKLLKKTDKITISSQTQRTDSQFISMLKTQILNELKAGTSEDKLNDIKRQLSTGSYGINPADTAYRMLFV